MPPIVGGMKPDFLLAMLFVALYIDNSPKNALVAGILAGIFSALTTGFPGGQVANMCDKIVTAFVVMLMIRVFDKFNSNFSVIITAFVGTVISGVVFLQTALLIVGNLPVAFPVLFTTVVIPLLWSILLLHSYAIRLLFLRKIWLHEMYEAFGPAHIVPGLYISFR